MIAITTIHPDAELRDFLAGKILVKDENGNVIPLAIFKDHEKPTNDSPSDFILIFVNGNIKGLGPTIDFAKGNLRIDLYCKMNNDGSIKSNRIDKILDQFSSLVDRVGTENFFYEYDIPRFITPTTPNISSGYSVTTLNLKWTTNSNFNKS